MHLVPSDDGRRFEGGCSPGQDVPVFDCDFGKLEIQICYDMEFDYSWNELARKGAEIIAWPTQSPADVPARLPRYAEPLLHHLEHVAE